MTFPLYIFLSFSLSLWARVKSNGMLIIIGCAGRRLTVGRLSVKPHNPLKPPYFQ